ncbi:hypothetical protein C5167_006069 [Papaver somniferum]|uniref:Uncharacterized protein n=1 Tax=Papaver somniferum TaxID=3469 RepID=A0A4Y7JE03_PAPSO|nr:hypothetical protein C5167_006069 [Papaver somniferum]
MKYHLKQGRKDTGWFSLSRRSTDVDRNKEVHRNFFVDEIPPKAREKGHRLVFSVEEKLKKRVGNRDMLDFGNMNTSICVTSYILFLHVYNFRTFVPKFQRTL